MVNNLIKNYPMPLVTRDMQIKTTTRYLYTLTIAGAFNNMEQLELSHIIGGSIKWNSHFAK